MKNNTVKNANYYQNEILKIFNNMAGKYSASEIFTDWLEWNASTMQSFRGENWEHLKTTFDYLANKYDRSHFEQFKVIDEILNEGLIETAEDILGVVFMKMSPTKNLGQFFTPTHCCSLLVKLQSNSHEDIKKEIEEQGCITVSDPTCGGGALLIAYYKYAKENGIDTSKILFHGKDIDRRCAQMTYLQLQTLDANALIEVGDTLLNTTTDTFLTTNLMLAQIPRFRLLLNGITYQEMLNEFIDRIDKK